ncbi:MAG TPA: hypothetical protein VGN83_03680 [Falsiroseomonas sp.]|nr:hypothetical protein [Falsiroseomonas sp.]
MAAETRLGLARDPVTVGPVETPALNLALGIDISGSMAGEKIEAARCAAIAVVEALIARDRLSVIAFPTIFGRRSGRCFRLDALSRKAAVRRSRTGLRWLASCSC